MTPADLLIDFFERILENGLAVVDGLTDEQLAHRITPDANSIGWLVWHTVRVQDSHIAHAAGTDELWLADGWADRFGLDLEPADHGYGHTSEQVGKVLAPAGLLADYLRATHEATVGYLRSVTEADLDEIIDRAWDPPVTRGTRLVSIVDDDAQHLGQAAYLRGLLSA